MVFKLFSLCGPNMSLQGQGFRIFPSLWGHFCPKT